MSPHNFSHIYEIFATFTIAYLIIDKLDDNPFISVITEKVLRKNVKIDDSCKHFRETLQGHKESLASIEESMRRTPAAFTADLHQDFPMQQQLLDSIDQRANVYFRRVQDRIRRNYGSRIFNLLNCFLLGYCLAMICLGGFYVEGFTLQTAAGTKAGIPITPDHAYLNNDYLDNCVFVVVFLSVVLLIVGWSMDKQPWLHNRRGMPINMENAEQVIEEGKGQNQEWFLVKNGYPVVMVYFFLIVILSVVTYYCQWHYGIDFRDGWPHRGLIILSLFIPLMNFAYYFNKARRRSNRCIPFLVFAIEEKTQEWSTNLDPIQVFITTCGYHLGRNRPDVS